MSAGLLDLLEFVVHGPPVGAPRSRSGGKFHRRDQSADPWQESIRAAAREALVARSLEPGVDPALAAAVFTGEGEAFGSGAVLVGLWFRFPRPDSHFTKRGALSAEGRRRPWPTVKPDRDNVDKAVLDALGNWRGKGSILWADDCVVCRGPVEKRYATESIPPGVAVRVRKLLAPAEEVDPVELAIREQDVSARAGKRPNPTGDFDP